MRHIGPYWKIGATFGRLQQWLTSHNASVTGEAIAVYYDDPGTTPENELQSHACFVVDGQFTADDEGVETVDVTGGKYVVYIHIGAYSGLSDSWDRVYSECLPTANVEIDPSRPCFEVYLNDCNKVRESELQTEI
jgi:AraC family transcriptional regulator